MQASQRRVHPDTQAPSDLTAWRAEWEAQLLACLPLDPVNSGAFSRLAQEALDAGQLDLAARAMLYESSERREMGQLARADMLCLRATKLARQADSASEEFRALLNRSSILAVRGRHREAFYARFAALKSQDGHSTVDPFVVAWGYVLLGDWCRWVDDSHSEIVCVEAAADVYRRRGLPVRCLVLTACCEAWLNLYLVSSEVFACAVAPAQLPAAERNALLERVGQTLALARHSPGHHGDPLAVRHAAHLQDVHDALASGNAAPLAQGLARCLGTAQGELDHRMRELVGLAGAAVQLHRPELAQRCMEACDSGLPVRHQERFDQQRLLIESIAAEQAGHHSQSRELYVRYAQAAMATSQRLDIGVRDVRQCIEGLRSDRTLVTPVMPTYLRVVLNRMESLPDGGGAVAELAEAVGVSERTLRDAFHQYLGQSPKQYQTSLRLAQADKLLRQSAPGQGLTLAEVASQVGFSNPARFASAYKAKYQSVPTARDGSLRSP